MKTALKQLFWRYCKSGQYWSIALALRTIWISHQGADLDLFPFLPLLSAPLSPKRTIPYLVIKGTMRLLGGPLGRQTGGLQSRMPNIPGYFGASQQQNYRVRTKDLAHFRLTAVVTHQLNTSVSSCVPILGKPKIWNLNIIPHPLKTTDVGAR